MNPTISGEFFVKSRKKEIAEEEEEPDVSPAEDSSAFEADYANGVLLKRGKLVHG